MQTEDESPAQQARCSPHEAGNAEGGDVATPPASSPVSARVATLVRQLEQDAVSKLPKQTHHKAFPTERARGICTRLK